MIKHAVFLHNQTQNDLGDDAPDNLHEKTGDKKSPSEGSSASENVP